MASILQTQGINLGNGRLSSEIGRGGQDFLDTPDVFTDTATGRDPSKTNKKRNKNSSAGGDSGIREERLERAKLWEKPRRRRSHTSTDTQSKEFESQRRMAGQTNLGEKHHFAHHHRRATRSRGKPSEENTK
jgi:hypothetical protein